MSAAMTTRRDFIRSAAVVAGAAVPGLRGFDRAVAADGADRPNIVWFRSD